MPNGRAPCQNQDVALVRAPTLSHAYLWQQNHARLFAQSKLILRSVQDAIVVYLTAWDKGSWPPWTRLDSTGCPDNAPSWWSNSQAANTGIPFPHSIPTSPRPPPEKIDPAIRFWRYFFLFLLKPQFSQFFIQVSRQKILGVNFGY